MTDPADLAAADQYLAAQRAATIQDIAAVLAAVRGRPTRVATAVYDAAIGPMLALVDASLLAIHDAIAPYPDALAAVQQAISALPRPEETP